MKVLAVHAHPDDESIWTGGALARFAREGAQVRVITCTNGEEGEIIGLADIVEDLASYRLGELDKARKILGVEGMELGFRDSGMVGSTAASNPRALVNNKDDASREVEEAIREFSPDLVITYGPDGGYGHPDHIAAHQITHAALSRIYEAGAPPQLWWSVQYRPAVEEGQKHFTLPEGWQWPDEDYLDNGTDDISDITIELSEADVNAKRDAMAAHATQVWIADGSVSRVNPSPAYSEFDDAIGGVYALSNLLAFPITRTEHYQRADIHTRQRQEKGES